MKTVGVAHFDLFLIGGKFIPKGLRSFFKEEDPFLFRTEFYILVPVVIYDVIIMVLSWFPEIPQFTKLVLFSLDHLFLLLGLVIFPIIIAFIWSIKEMFTREISQSEFESLFKDRYATALFQRHCMYEGVVEYVLLYVSCK